MVAAIRLLVIANWYAGMLACGCIYDRLVVQPLTANGIPLALPLVPFGLLYLILTLVFAAAMEDGLDAEQRGATA